MINRLKLIFAFEYLYVFEYNLHLSMSNLRITFFYSIENWFKNYSTSFSHNISLLCLKLETFDLLEHDEDDLSESVGSLLHAYYNQGCKNFLNKKIISNCNYLAEIQIAKLLSEKEILKLPCLIWYFYHRHKDIAQVKV